MKRHATVVVALVAGISGGVAGSLLTSPAGEARAAGAPAAGPLRASRVEIVDAGGNVRATLAAGADGAYLTMVGRNGKRQVWISAGKDNSYVALNDSRGKGFVQMQVQAGGSGTLVCVDRDGDVCGNTPHIYGPDRIGFPRRDHPGEVFNCTRLGECRLHNVQSNATSETNRKKVLEVLNGFVEGVPVRVRPTGRKDKEGRKICKVNLPNGTDLSKLAVRFAPVKPGYRAGVLPGLKPVRLKPRIHRRR